jgi:membrane protease YdiL (CAAX protease family)
MTRALARFFLLTYGASWLCWLGAASLRGRPGGSALASALILLGVFAPGLVALALTDRAAGRAATHALLHRVFLWRVPVRWYLFALLYMPAIKLTVALVHRLATGAWPQLGHTVWYVIVAAIPISTMTQAGEEIGWRGYALPRLTEQLGLRGASLILGVIWASWHLPLFFFPASDTFGQSFPLYLLQVTAASVAAAWLYWRTEGSLLLVMLWHAAVNNTKDIIPSSVPGATNSLAFSTSTVAWLTVAFLWIAALYFLARMPRTATLPAPFASSDQRFPKSTALI